MTTIDVRRPPCVQRDVRRYLGNAFVRQVPMSLTALRFGILAEH
jgi:hypothetical protein